MAAMLLAAGCGQPAVSRPGVAAPELVWPRPPERPRIRFIRTISEPRDLAIDAGWLARVVGFLKGATPKRVIRPYGVATDSEGRLYVVDTFQKVVHVFDRENAVYYAIPDRPIPGFVNPIDVAVAKDGRVFVSDSKARVIHVFTEHGKTYQQSIGAGQLQRPTGVAINETTAELLVVDTLASRLAVYDAAQLQLKKLAGKHSRAADGFHYPTHITVSGEGLIYVTDSLNFRVQVLSPSFEFLSSFGAPGDSPGHFSRPRGIATDSEGNVYVVDALFDNVQIFDKHGKLLLAFGVPGHERGQFWLPAGIFVDDRDRVYVADSFNQRIQVFQRLAAP